MAETSTSLCNMALARFGARRINNYADMTDTKLEAVYCRLFYPQTAKALMTDHFWPFAVDRVALSQDTTDPAFQYDYAYLLPNDFLRPIIVYDGTDEPDGRTQYTYSIEGNRLLCDETSVYLIYVKWVESESDWSTLFIEAMTLFLARKLCIPLSQDLKLKVDIDRDLAPLMRQVRAMDRQMQQRIGRADLLTWRDARFSDTA